MHASEVTPEAIERANELYWHSDRSVNQIADELDLSKGALYGVIEPEATGLACPLCGDQVGYANRTAKDRGTLDCATCSWDGAADETIPWDPAASAERDHPVLPADPHGSGEYGDVPDKVPPPPVVAPRMSTIAGGALLGAAVGLALVMWARRR